MKFIILSIMLIICFGCVDKSNVKAEYYGIDVSGSALSNLDKNLLLMKNQMLESDVENINIFIFADKTYEVYSGQKPIKDRQVSAILNQAILKSKTIKWNPGTSFDNVMDYLLKRVKNNSDLYIYTDGFFELKKYSNNKEQEIASKACKSGLKNIKFFGINLSNKDIIYNIFKDTDSKIDLN